MTIFGSLSDTLNSRNLKLGHGLNEDYFDRDIVIIATAHREVYSVVKSALNDAGLSSNIINLQVISPDLFKWGLGKEADTLSFLNRVALIEEDNLADDYLDNPPAIVFRYAKS